MELKVWLRYSLGRAGCVSRENFKGERLGIGSVMLSGYVGLDFGLISWVDLNARRQVLSAPGVFATVLA